MNTLHEWKNSLEREEIKLTRRLKEIRVELRKIYAQIRQNDDSEIRQEVEQEVNDLMQDELSQGRYWKSPEGKRKRQNRDTAENNEEKRENTPKKRIKKWKVKIEDLVQEDTETNLEFESVPEEHDKDIAFLFEKANVQDKRTKSEQRKGILNWYEYAEELRNEMVKEQEKDEWITDKDAIKNIYKKIEEKYPGKYTNNTKSKRTVLARKIHRIFSQYGGRERIMKLRKTSIRNFKELTNEQIEEWEQTLPREMEMETEIELEIPGTPMYLGTEELDRNLRMLGYTDDKINDELRNRIKSILMEGGRINEIEKMRIGPSIRMTLDIEVEAGSRPTIPIVIDETQWNI
jgi:hypothetical protein